MYPRVFAGDEPLSRGSQEGKSQLSDEDEAEDDEDEDTAKKPLRTTFELNDTLYAEAELEDTDTVYLWLGVCSLRCYCVSLTENSIPKANVMLSYKLPAAITLLSSKLEGAEQTLDNIIADLEFLREQMTVMEVNIARVYNWDVKKRREKRELEARESGGKGVGKDSG